jgi:hypothetical protein
MKDEYKKVQIPFGFNAKGMRVSLPLFHSFYVAMTGHGKTLGMKSLLFRFHEQHPDWKILIIDSKDKRDYQDLNSDIPICFVETTEPLDLKALLEPIVSSNLMYYFDKIIEEAVFDTLGEIQRSIAHKIEEADAHRVRMSGKDLGKLRVLNYTMRKLVALVEKPNIVKDLRLHDGFNVMPVSLPDVKNPTLKRAFQQLIVRSVLVLLLSDQSLEKTLLVLDESHKWSSQKYGSICKQPLSEFVSEGRSQDKFVWLSDQALTKVDKEPLKNVKLWIVGQQMESNEVEDAKDTVNSITDLNVKDTDIKTLKVGNFIVVDGLHGKVERAYLQPFNVPDALALKIAEGADPELAEDLIREFEAHKAKSQSSKTQEDDEKVWKEKYEKLAQEFEKQKKDNEELKAQVGDVCSELEERKKKQEAFDRFKDSFTEVFGLHVAIGDSSHPKKVSLEYQGIEVTVKDLSAKEIVLTTEKPSGKLMHCALTLTQKALAETKDPVFTSADLLKEAAENGWQMANITLGKTLAAMQGEGWLIQENNSYRLPSLVKFKVEKT